MQFDNRTHTHKGIPVRAIAWNNLWHRWEGLIWSEKQDKFVECIWDENGACPDDPDLDLVESNKAWRSVKFIHQVKGRLHVRDGLRITCGTCSRLKRLQGNGGTVRVRSSQDGRTIPGLEQSQVQGKAGAHEQQRKSKERNAQGNSRVPMDELRHQSYQRSTKTILMERHIEIFIPYPTTCFCLLLDGADDLGDFDEHDRDFWKKGIHIFDKDWKPVSTECITHYTKGVEIVFGRSFGYFTPNAPHGQRLSIVEEKQQFQGVINITIVQ